MNSACHGELRVRVTANMSAHRGNISWRWKLSYNDSRQWRAALTDVAEKPTRRLWVKSSELLRLRKREVDFVSWKFSGFRVTRQIAKWNSSKLGRYVARNFLDTCSYFF